MKRFGLLGAGALVALAGAIGARFTAEVLQSGDPPVALWAADRDGNAVYGLDEDLILTCRAVVERPTAVAARPDGGAWVLRAADWTPAGASSLVRIDARGVVRSEVGLRTCSDLACLGDGSAIVLEKHGDEDGRDRVLACREDGSVEVAFRARELTCVAALDGSIAIGDAEGVVRRVALAALGTVLASVDVHGRITGIEAAPRGGGVWALAVSDGRARVHRLGPALEVRWTADVGSPAPSLGADDDGENLWLVDGDGSAARRLDERGAVVVDLQDLPLLGAGRAIAARGGGVTIATPGCILRLDRSGSPLPGQGGFAHLVDIDRVPRTRPAQAANSLASD